MLSGDLATVLSGRYIEISILHFSFAEFAKSYTDTPKAEIFADYFECGGFPEVANFIQGGAKSEYRTTWTAYTKQFSKRT